MPKKLPKRTCSAVVALYQQRRSYGFIANQLGLARSSVQRIIQRFNRTGGSQAGPPRRPKAVRTPQLIRRVARLIDRNPRRTISGLAKLVGTTWNTMAVLIKRDLGLRSLKLRRVQLLTPQAQQRRLARCQALLTRWTQLGMGKVLFSDEKIFTVNQKPNRQNDRVLVAGAAVIPPQGIVPQAAHATSVHVWAGVSARGKLKLRFVPRGQNIDSGYLNHILKPAVREAQTKLYPGGQAWCFQQDGASPHTAAQTQNWLAQAGLDFVTAQEWPPYSPDVNVVDFAVWGPLQAAVNRRGYTNRDELIVALKIEWKKLDQTLISNAVAAVPGRLRKIVAANGGYIQ